jgi:HJR/Mrr/RecB family endonuclease
MFTRRERYQIRLFFKTITKTVIFIISTLTAIIQFTIKSVNKLVKWYSNYWYFKGIDYSYSKVVNLLRKMNSRQFEIFCAELYKAQGHRVKLTPPGNDYGRDVIVDGDIFVECKHYYGSWEVGREICQKLLGSMQMFKARKGVIFTTGKIHNNAYEVARMVNNLELVDTEGIIKMIKTINPKQLPNIMTRVFSYSDQSIPDLEEELV